MNDRKKPLTFFEARYRLQADTYRCIAVVCRQWHLDKAAVRADGRAVTCDAAGDRLRSPE